PRAAPGSSAQPPVLASSYGREQRDLVTLADRVIAPVIVLVHRDPDDRQVAQCLGVTAAAAAQPFEERRDVTHPGGQRQLLLGLPDPRPQPGEIQQLHDPNTSENGKNSTIAPGTSSLRLSSRTANPSDCTIEDRMPAPSFGYLRATMAPSSRARVARRYSRRPAFLR